MGWTNVSGVKLPSGNTDDIILPTGSKILALVPHSYLPDNVVYIHAIVQEAGGSTTIWRHVGPRATIRWQAIPSMTLPVSGQPYDISGYAEDTSLNRLYIANRTNKTVYYTTNGAWTAAIEPISANTTINQLAWYNGKLYLAHDRGVAYYIPKAGAGTLDSWVSSLTFYGDNFNCFGLFVYKGRLYTTSRDGTGVSYIYKINSDTNIWEAVAKIPEDQAQYLAEWGQSLFVTCDKVAQSIFSDKNPIPASPETNNVPILNDWKQLKGVPSSALMYPKDTKLYISTWDVGHELEPVTPIVNLLTSLTATTNATSTPTESQLSSMTVISTPPYNPAQFADVNSSTGGFLIDYYASNIAINENKQYKMVTGPVDVVSGNTYNLSFSTKFNGVVKFFGVYLLLTKYPKLQITMRVKDHPELASHIFTITAPRDFLNALNQVNYLTGSWVIPQGVTSVQFEFIATVTVGDLTAQEAVLFNYCNLTSLSFAYFTLINLATLQSTYIEPEFLFKSVLSVPIGYQPHTTLPSPPDDWFIKFPVPPDHTPINKLITRQITTNTFNITYSSASDNYRFRCSIKYKYVSDFSHPTHTEPRTVRAPLYLTIKYVNTIKGSVTTVYNTTVESLDSDNWVDIDFIVQTKIGRYINNAIIPVYFIITGESNPNEGSIMSEFHINDMSFMELGTAYPQNLIYRHDGISWDYIRASRGLPPVSDGSGGPHNLITYNDVASNSGQRLYCIHNDAAYLWALRGDPGVDPRDLDEGRRLIISF